MTDADADIAGRPDPETAPLTGHVLIAMPDMRDPRFHRTVIYVCAHSREGAMGLIVNKPAETLSLKDLFERLGIPITGPAAREPVRFGGPVETGRGFVLHSDDYGAEDDATLDVVDGVAMTATVDILHAMAEGRGPARALVALGYAGWAAGQLEAEIQANGWLVGDADPDLLFDSANESKWQRAMRGIGVDPSLLASGGSA